MWIMGDSFGATHRNGNSDSLFQNREQNNEKKNRQQQSTNWTILIVHHFGLWHRARELNTKVDAFDACKAKPKQRYNQDDSLFPIGIAKQYKQ